MTRGAPCSAVGYSPMSTIFYVNPAAGCGRAGRVWQGLCRYDAELAQARLISEKGQQAAEEALTAALADPGLEQVIAVGGDGTIHLVLNHLLAQDCSERVALGLIPAGTGSDLARSLSLPRRPRAALHHLRTARPRSIDVIAVRSAEGERRCGLNIASAGVSGAVAAAVNAGSRRGAGTYLLTTLSALMRYQPVPCKVEIDGEPFFDGPFFIAAIANGRYFGKGMKVAPRAEVDDGLLDVVLVPPVPLWSLPYRVPQFLSGRHIELPFVKSLRGRRIRLTPQPGFPPCELDGEALPAGPLEIEILPAAVRMLV